MTNNKRHHVLLHPEQARQLRKLAFHFSKKQDKTVSMSSIIRLILDRIDEDSVIKKEIFREGV